MENKDMAEDQLEDCRPAKEIQIGPYRLSETSEGTAIYHEDGEGGVFNTGLLSAVIAQFYKDQF